MDSDSSWYIHTNNNSPTPIDEEDLTESMVSTPFGITRVLQIGLKVRLTEETAFKGVKRVIFIMPGNPGEIHFYRDIMKQLFEKTRIPIIGVSHIGLFREGTDSVQTPITVRKLTQHKIHLIEQYIPSRVQIIQIGHSIGGFMAVEIMKNIEERSRILHTVLLMPSIDHLAKSAGYRYMNWMYPLRFILYAFIFIMSCLPESFVESSMMRLAKVFFDPPDCVGEGILDLMSVSVASNCLTLAQDEFKQVQERDDTFISRHIKEITFFYCQCDEWVTQFQVEDLKNTFPNADITVVENVIHAFNADRKMIQIMTDLISEKLQRFSTDAINHND